MNVILKHSEMTNTSWEVRSRGTVKWCTVYATVSGFAISTELYLCVSTISPRHVGSMELKLHII